MKRKSNLKEKQTGGNKRVNGKRNVKDKQREKNEVFTRQTERERDERVNRKSNVENRQKDRRERVLEFAQMMSDVEMRGNFLLFKSYDIMSCDKDEEIKLV